MRNLPAPMTSEIADGPLEDMFADSDDELGPITPSKSARRRMRRRRQREALKAVMGEMRHEEETWQDLEFESMGRTVPRSIITLEDLGLDLTPWSGTVGETSEVQLDTSSPAHQAWSTRVPSLPSRTKVNIMSTCPVSPASVASTCMTRISPFSDASTRPLPSRTPHSQTQSFHYYGSGAPSVEANRGQVLGWCCPSPLATPSGATSIMAVGTMASPVGTLELSDPMPCTPFAVPAAPGVESSANEQRKGTPATGHSAEETLRVLFGSENSSSWGEVAEKLQAAAPEVYED